MDPKFNGVPQEGWWWWWKMSRDNVKVDIVDHWGYILECTVCIMS